MFLEFKHVQTLLLQCDGNALILEACAACAAIVPLPKEGRQRALQPARHCKVRASLKCQSFRLNFPDLGVRS